MFNQINADQVLDYLGKSKPKRILVVGSGCGSDIIAFRNRLGPSPLVVGVDVDIRANSFSQIPNTLLVQIDITKQPILGNCFDLAYSFATFEHIHDLKKGWQAMMDVLRPGGLLWSVASPLWFSPFGHHKPMFKQYPWLHLLHPTPEQLMRFCTENNIVCEDGIPMIHHINYLFNPLYFNMHSASAYLQAAGELRNAMIEKNDFDFICESEFEPLLSRLEAMGHSKKNLLAQTHRLIARRC